MPQRLAAVLDHVAVAVADPEVALRRWEALLGGSLVSFSDGGGFRARQLRFAGGGKLELLSPAPEPGGFVRGFLDRFGSRVHHVTLRVPDLAAAIAALESEGLDVVDVQLTDEWWREAFLRPKQVGGLVVQVAWSRASDADWAARVGHVEQPVAAGAATLRGPLLRHPDLDAAARLWTVLGAAVERDDDGRLRCTWPSSQLDVEVEAGDPAGPVGVRMAGTDPLPADAELGSAVLRP